MEQRANNVVPALGDKSDMFGWWSWRAAHGCVDLGPWKMPQHKVLRQDWQGEELELPQDKNGSFISEWNTKSGIMLLSTSTFSYIQDSGYSEVGLLCRAFLLFHLHLAREEQEMSRDREDVKIAVVVLKAFWDNFCMDWKLMLKRKAHLIDYFWYWNDDLLD